MRKFLKILALLLLGFTLLQLWATRERTDQKKQVDANESQGEAQVGGSFTLTDQNGNLVHDSDFRGRVMLVYFGFTHCPDICPVSTAAMSQALQLLGEKADQVAPLFITVDPQEDTAAVLKDYLANFDRHMIGLTGTPEEIQQVAGNYKAYFSKKNIPWDENGAPPPADAKEHYTVDHSGFIYMMGKDGKYVRLFPYDAKPEEIAHAVAQYLGS